MSIKYKLSFPVYFDREGTSFTLSDQQLFSLHLNGSVKRLLLKGVDNDGFLIFEVEKQTFREEPTALPTNIRVTPNPTITGYEYAFETQARSSGSGFGKGKYVYFKNEANGTYYVEVLGGKENRRIPLGSIMDLHSPVGTVLQAVPQGIFKQKNIADTLPKYGNDRQKLKGCIDILVKEGFLAEVKTKGISTTYRATMKLRVPLEKFANVREVEKPQLR